MKTRSGFFYEDLEEGAVGDENKRGEFVVDRAGKRRRRRTTAACDAAVAVELDFFEGLSDDLVLLILCKLSSSSETPSDLISIQTTCKRLMALGLNRSVLSKASPRSLAVRAKNWSDSSHRFLKIRADAGNLEACYILGMIRFYCTGSRASGASLMARAAMGSHAAALYSLAVIQFNGSGGSKPDKDLRAGAALCARAASLGNVDAIRELGHCLQDGYGVRRSVSQGRRFLLHANARELAASGAADAVFSDSGCAAVPPPKPHAANRFLSEWFAVGSGPDPGLRMCSNAGCGRPETRQHEFRRCSVCGGANYCSRACQALDWKMAHKAHCYPLDRWAGFLHNGPAGPI